MRFFQPIPVRGRMKIPNTTFFERLLSIVRRLPAIESKKKKTFSFWKRSFVVRLILINTGLWFVLSLATGIVVFQVVSQSLENKMGEELLAMGRLVERQLSNRLSELHQPSLPDSSAVSLSLFLKGFLDTGMLQNVTLLNSQGTVLVDATGESVPGFKSPLLSNFMLNRLAGNKPVLLPVYAGDFGTLHQSVFIPISRESVLQVDANPKFLEVLKRFRNYYLSLGLAGFLISAVVSAFVARTVLKPVGKVTHLAQEVAEGRYPFSLVEPVGREDELGKLENSLLRMAFQIKTREEELSGLKQAAEEQADQMKEIAGGIAHEVRNPLGIIGGEAEWVGRMTTHLPEVTPAVQKIQSQVKALNHLVTVFLEYSRAIKVNNQPLDLAVILTELGDILAASASHQGVIIKIETGPCGKIGGDKALLSNSFYNLGLNALQAMPQGGILILRLREEGSYALVEVEDNGPGITPKILPNLFKPFYTDKVSGTGLGLAFAQKVAQSHGGKITGVNLDSGGALFRLHLPLLKGS
jgi:signal transduction histidine kinase